MTKCKNCGSTYIHCFACPKYDPEVDVPEKESASSFFESIKNDPKAILEWCDSEIKAYRELKVLIKSAGKKCDIVKKSVLYSMKKYEKTYKKLGEDGTFVN